MTPAQIDTVTNGLVNLHAFIDRHWPALIAFAIAGACWWAMWRWNRRQTRRQAAIDDGIRQLEQYANDPDTRRLQDDINTQPREEEL